MDNTPLTCLDSDSIRDKHKVSYVGREQNVTFILTVFLSEYAVCTVKQSPPLHPSSRINSLRLSSDQ